MPLQMEPGSKSNKLKPDQIHTLYTQEIGQVICAKCKGGRGHIFTHSLILKHKKTKYEWSKMNIKQTKTKNKQTKTVVNVSLDTHNTVVTKMCKNTMHILNHGFNMGCNMTGGMTYKSEEWQGGKDISTWTHDYFCKY